MAIQYRCDCGCNALVPNGEMEPIVVRHAVAELRITVLEVAGRHFHPACIRRMTIEGDWRPAERQAEGVLPIRRRA